jgi:hypothetical protein
MALPGTPCKAAELCAQMLAFMERWSNGVKVKELVQK